MILNYQNYISKYEDISKVGNIIDLKSNKYKYLLDNGYVDYHNEFFEEGTLISSYALIYNDEIDFPYDFTDKKFINKFLSILFLCKYESELNKLILNNKSSLISYLPKIKNKVKNIPTLGESIKLSSLIDKRLPKYLLTKNNYLDQICCGCGYSGESFTCYDFDCYSDYAWIVDGLCYIYFGGSLSGISFISLFPFIIDNN